MKQQKKSLQRQRLTSYIEKLSNQQSHYLGMMKEMQVQMITQAQQQIKDRFIKLQAQFAKLKKNTQQELNTLKYYQEHPEQKGNLFALFNQIDEKICFNMNIIKSTHFQISLPFPSQTTMQQDVNSKKIMVYENYVSQLINIMKSENIRKYCKKQAQASDKVMTNFQRLIESTKQSLYSTQVKIKKEFQEGIAEVSQYKHVQNLTLCLTTQKGVMSNDQYHQIINSLHPNRLFLARLTLKLMDMQFTQEKCDILRKRIGAQLGRLKHLSIQNYYKECKLGMFEDFTWSPYRKQVHIISGVW